MAHSGKLFARNQRRGLVRSRRTAIFGAVASLAFAGVAEGIPLGDVLDVPIEGVAERPIDDPLPDLPEDPILDPGPGTIDADTYLWASISRARGGVDLQVFLASRLRTDRFFARGQIVGSIQFPLPLPLTRGEPRIASLLVIAESDDVLSKMVTFGAWIDLDSDGTVDRPADDFDVAVSVRFATYLTSPSPHLIVELTVPVAVPALSRLPEVHLPIGGPEPLFPVTPSFLVGHLLDDRSSLVRVGSALTHVGEDDRLSMRFEPAVDRVAAAALVHGNPDSINLRSGGTASVAILSRRGLAAAVLNPFMFRWFDPRDPSQEASPHSAEARDVDGDGLVDLVLAFDVEELMSSGVLDETSDFAAFRSLEDTRPGGTAPVRVSAEQLLRRGDSNNDGDVNLSDALHTLSWLFLGGEAPLCPDAADSNDDAAVNITDPLSTLGWLFLGSVAPAAPGPYICGFDVNADSLPECAPQVCAGA